MTADHSEHVRLHVDAAQAAESDADEMVPARHLGGDLYLILGTPGLVYGCAAGDTIRVDADGRFDVIERGGNIAVHIYSEQALEARQINDLRVRFEPLGGLVEAPPQASFAVVTVPVLAGFPAIETAMADWVANQPGTEWFFGNVYDAADAPLRWWEEPG